MVAKKRPASRKRPQKRAKRHVKKHAKKRFQWSRYRDDRLRAYVKMGLSTDQIREIFDPHADVEKRIATLKLSVLHASDTNSMAVKPSLTQSNRALLEIPMVKDVHAAIKQLL